MEIVYHEYLLREGKDLEEDRKAIAQGFESFMAHTKVDIEEMPSLDYQPKEALGITCFDRGIKYIIIAFTADGKLFFGYNESGGLANIMTRYTFLDHVPELIPQFTLHTNF